MHQLGPYLKKLRNSHGLSQKDVFQATGITNSRLSRIENGTLSSPPDLATLKALARLYKVNLIEIYLQTGYLDDESISSYERVFHGVDLLSSEEKIHIQQQIDLFTKGRI